MMNPHLRYALRMEIKRMERLGIIERSNTRYINSLVPVFKKDNSVRVCLAALDLNQRLQSDHDGPDDIDQVFKRLHEFSVMSSLDLTASYWQVPLDPESRKYTGFLFEGKTYHFCVVPFGTKVSCAALSRAAEHVLKNLDHFLVDFADDWLCLSNSFSDHLQHLEILFQRCYDEGVTINFAKVKFFRSEMRFLGYILTPDGIKPDADKIQGIHDYPAPQNIKQLRGFLGVLNFSSRFSHRLASEVNPLLILLKKGTKWKWTIDDQQSFEEIKNLFVNDVLLYHPKLNRTFYLRTDSSTTGLGALLYQRTAEDEKQLVCCASRNLRGSEINYFTTELELLSIVWALGKFRTFLLRSDLVIETDHKALSFLLTTRFLNDRLTR